jgi:hypothetical protein
MRDFDPASLLGKREDERLEFKDAEVLRRPARVAREVVGFLNGKGGDLWIGVQEDGEGRAVTTVPIADVERARIALRDHLIEAIEPKFQPDEVAITEEGGLLHLAVKRGGNPPYAQRDGGRHFCIRVDNRLREMDRTELRDAFRRADEPAELMRKVETAKKELRDEPNQSGLYVSLKPVPALNLDFFDEAVWREVQTWLTDPRATGNRHAGFKFSHGYAVPQRRDSLVLHGQVSDYKRTVLDDTGRISFWVKADGLRRMESAQSIIEPYALLEYPVSIMRLMATILARFGQGAEQVAGVLSLAGIRGWILRPGSPKEPMRAWQKPRPFDESVLDVERVFPADELAQNPDRCGLSFVRGIYARFDFDADAIPGEFDQLQGRLLLD